MKNVLLEMEKMNNMNSGLGQFCFHLGNSIAELPSIQFQPYFYLPSEYVSIFGKKFHYLKSNKLYRFFRIRNSFDVWHCLHQDSNYLPAKNTSKLVVTIHDLNFLEEKKSRIKQNIRLKRLQRLINKADAVTVISNYTEQVVRENLTIPNIPLKVIYNGNSLKTFTHPVRPSFAPGEKFFFSIGIISPKKNFISLIPLLTRFKDYYLILAGNKNHRYVHEILALSEKLGVADRLIFPGIISDEEKFWLYQNCAAFLFPSLAEGFGLPVVEAMSLGKPVFLSQATSLPEIGGKEAFYFLSFDPEEMADTVEKGLNEYNRDSSRSKNIQNWSKQFTWINAAKAYQELYLTL